MPPIKLAVGIPAYRSQVHIGVARTMLSLGHALVVMQPGQFEFQGFIDMDVCGVDRARNFLIAHAMKLDADWLLMIDSDTWVDKAHPLLRMIGEGHHLGATIIGAPVFRRVIENEAFNVVRWKDGSLVPINCYSVSKREPFQVDGIGAAIMAMNLHLIGEAAFKFTDKLSEDLDFCDQIRTMGGTIWCDPRVTTYHAKTGVMKFNAG